MKREMKATIAATMAGATLAGCSLLAFAGQSHARSAKVSRAPSSECVEAGVDAAPGTRCRALAACIGWDRLPENFECVERIGGAK